jgi:hypothetical protein
VQKIDYKSFRGSIAGLSFAYCDFSQRGNPRNEMIGRSAFRPTSMTTTVATARSSED